MVSMVASQRKHVHLTHWGAAEIESDGRRLTSVRPWREDPDPSRILENLATAHRHPARIDQPYIRQGWLEHGPGAAARGSDVFVPVSWTMALDLLAGELRRVYGSYGPDGVFGGSYGWASAGRFHHAQSQLHRFLNCLGGYVRSVNNYSFGTSAVLLPHVVGDTALVMGGAPAWAAALTGVPAERIRGLARQMAAAGRTLVTVSWSLQRAEHGEQPVWLGLVLAAMLGQIGLPGGGFGHGYGSSGDVGLPRRLFAPRLPQGANGIDSYIPVARIADMLLHPGAGYDYDGQRRRYPDVKLVYWCGGNPFHHHQDLARLREAFRRPQTVVVHDPFWTATARHADIVLPSTMSVERDDIGVGSGDSTLFAMPQLTEPYAQARDDYATFAALAERLGVDEGFTEGRTARQWLCHLYGQWRSDLKAAG